MPLSVPPKDINSFIALQFQILEELYYKGKADQNFRIYLITINTCI